MGGASGIAQSAANGDPLGIAAGALEVAAAIAGGLVSTNELAGNAALQGIANNVAFYGGIASGAASSADAFANGDLAGGLASSLNALFALVAQRVGQNQDAPATSGATSGGTAPGTIPALSGGGDGATPELLPSARPSVDASNGGSDNGASAAGPYYTAGAPVAAGGATVDVVVSALSVSQRLALQGAGILTAGLEVLTLPAATFFYFFTGGTSLAGPVTIATGVPGTSATYNGDTGAGTLSIYDLSGNVTSQLQYRANGDGVIVAPNGQAIGTIVSGVPSFSYRGLTDFAFPSFADTSVMQSTSVTPEEVAAEGVPNVKPVTGTGIIQVDKPGGISAANQDFDRLNPTNVRPYPNGTRVGDLPDGRTVDVREKSSGNIPTLGVTAGAGKPQLKIRYS